jgi:secreted Zn-dependent insulinase-like peptidase
MLESLFEEVDDDHVEESKRLSDLWGQEKKLQRLKFDYFQGQVPVKDFARNLNKYPAAKVLAADSQYEHLNPETIYNYLVELANPLNMVILIGDSDFTYEKGSDQTEFLENKLVDQRSDLYNLDYSVADISEANLRFMGQSLNSKNVQIKGEHSETTSLNL